MFMHINMNNANLMTWSISKRLGLNHRVCVSAAPSAAAQPEQHHQIWMKSGPNTVFPEEAKPQADTLRGADLHRHAALGLTPETGGKSESSADRMRPSQTSPVDSNSSLVAMRSVWCQFLTTQANVTHNIHFRNKVSLLVFSWT